MTTASWNIRLRANDFTLTIQESIDGATKRQAYARLLILEANAIRDGHRIDSAEYERISDWSEPSRHRAAPLDMLEIVNNLAAYTAESGFQVIDTKDREGTREIVIRHMDDADYAWPPIRLRYQDYDRFVTTAHDYRRDSGVSYEVALAAAAKPYVENLA